MEKLKKIWVCAEEADLRAELCGGAARMGEQVSVLIVGERASAAECRREGVEAVLYLGETGGGRIFEHYIPSIAALAETERPDLLLIGLTKRGRLLAGQLAASLGTGVLTDVSELTLEGGGVMGKKLVFGGLAERWERAEGPVRVACVGYGVFEAAGEASGACAVVDVPFVEPPWTIEVVERRPKTGQKVNLAAAKRVVGIGRGFGKEENLRAAYDFAEAAEAEVGCSRPVAEGEGWLPKERYIGISGVTVKPDVYFALGVSGQVQHMVGVNQARAVVAVNKDKNAPIFAQSDYGIVGDVMTVLPALTELLNK